MEDDLSARIAEYCRHICVTKFTHTFDFECTRSLIEADRCSLRPCNVLRVDADSCNWYIGRTDWFFWRKGAMPTSSAIQTDLTIPEHDSYWQLFFGSTQVATACVGTCCAHCPCPCACHSVGHNIDKSNSWHGMPKGKTSRCAHVDLQTAVHRHRFETKHNCLRPAPRLGLELAWTTNIV